MTLTLCPLPLTISPNGEGTITHGKALRDAPLIAEELQEVNDPSPE